MYFRDTPARESMASNSSGSLVKRRAARMMRLLPDLTGQTNDLRRMGSAAYDLCCVAAGRLDAFMELILNPYDIAAGTVIAREAGAIVGGWDETEDFRMTGNILAASPALFDPLRRLIAGNPK